MEAIKTGNNRLKARLRRFGVACGPLIILFLSSASEAKPAEMAAPVNASLPDEKFDRDAAMKALKAAAEKAKGCKMPDGPTGTGNVSATFAPSGKVDSALLMSGPFRGTTVGKCIIRMFLGAKVPPFSGSPVTVAKSVAIN